MYYVPCVRKICATLSSLWRNAQILSISGIVNQYELTINLQVAFWYLGFCQTNQCDTIESSVQSGFAVNH